MEENKKRKVSATIWDRNLKQRVAIIGEFHMWGQAYEEFHSGPGNYTMAIIELSGGRVVTAMPEDVLFVDE